MTNLKVIELFAGIGAVHEALKRWDLSFEVVDAVELDKTAMKAYNAIHNTKFETQDILTWDKNIKCDYLHTSPPCQAFSTNGKGLGAEDSRGWDLWAATLRIIKQTDPKWVTLENVKGLLNKKHKKVLDKYIHSMNELGYQTVVKTYNAKDFGVPQNRERVFIISIRLDMYNYVFKLRENYYKPGKIADIINAFLPNCSIGNLDFKGTMSNEMNEYHGKTIVYDLNVQNIKNHKINKVATIKEVEFNEDKHFLSPLGISGAITATNPRFKNKIMWLKEESIVCYRKLTTEEIFSLMGNHGAFSVLFLLGLSDNQMCKLAGNSMVVNVIYEIIGSFDMSINYPMVNHYNRKKIGEQNE